jgi:hypothetical protein
MFVLGEEPVEEWFWMRGPDTSGVEGMAEDAMSEF